MHVIQSIHPIMPLTLLQSDATIRSAAVQRNPVTASFTNRPVSHSPTIQQQPFSALHNLRKLLPFAFHRDAAPLTGIVEPRDPLDVRLFLVSSAIDLITAPQYPATSPRLGLPTHSSLAPATDPVPYNPSDNVSLHSSTKILLTFLQPRPIPALPISQSSISVFTTITSRLHQLSNWLPIHTGHALPPVVRVPLAQGKEVCLVELCRYHQGLIH